MADTTSDTPIGDEKLSNLARFYGWRYDELFKAWGEKKREESFNIARELLMEADLPIFFRAGCSLVLADNGYERVRYTKEALALYKQMAAEAPAMQSYQKLVEIATRAHQRALELGDREYSGDEEVEDEVMEDEQDTKAGYESLTEGETKEEKVTKTATADAEIEVVQEEEDKAMGESQESYPGRIYPSDARQTTPVQGATVITPGPSRTTSENTKEQK